jgi:acetamidase/formamidase
MAQFPVESEYPANSINQDRASKIKERTHMEETHFVPKERHAFALDASLPPILAVTPPCVVTFETRDMPYVRLAQGDTVAEIGFQNFNPVTCPVLVHGAEPGDVLRIEVLEITVKSAWSAWFPGLGMWGKQTDHVQIRQVPIEDEWAIINAYAYASARVSLRFGGPASPIVLAVVPDVDVPYV